MIFYNLTTEDYFVIFTKNLNCIINSCIGIFSYKSIPVNKLIRLNPRCHFRGLQRTVLFESFLFKIFYVWVFFLLEIKTTNNAEAENVSYNSALRSFRTNDSHLLTASPFFLVSDGGREGGRDISWLKK